MSDAEKIQKLEAVLREARSWMRHWQDDVSANLTPTDNSLAKAIEQINAALKRSA
jgi:hypothetical protein